jgi:hypothetical protein
MFELFMFCPGAFMLELFIYWFILEAPDGPLEPEFPEPEEEPTT